MFIVLESFSFHVGLCSDSSGISRIADGFNGIFSDHCYSVCSMRQPDLKCFDNKGIFNILKNIFLQIFCISPLCESMVEM